MILEENFDSVQRHVVSDDDDADDETLAKATRDHMVCQADGQNRTLWKIPHFIIAGTQKGGTTALRNILGIHPDIEYTPPRTTFL